MPCALGKAAFTYASVFFFFFVLKHMPSLPSMLPLLCAPSALLTSPLVPPHPSHALAVRFFHTVKKGVHRVWVDHPAFLSKVWGLTGSKLYGQKSGADYSEWQQTATVGQGQGQGQCGVQYRCQGAPPQDCRPGPPCLVACWGQGSRPSSRSCARSRC